MMNDKTMHCARWHVLPFIILLCAVCHVSFSPAGAQTLTFVELNCENLFDTRHDSLKQDTEFAPDGVRRWTTSNYWRKLKHIGQEILSCSAQLPDIVALVEVENDSVLHALLRRSVLRQAGYQYLMTESPDVRGLDVALVYQPYAFRPICYEAIGVAPLPGMRPTRDVLYVKGRCLSGDTLHVFVVHAPSRYGGERATRPNRMQVMHTLLAYMQTLPQNAKVIVAGDFNDYADSPSVRLLCRNGLQNVTKTAVGTHGAKGTYRYQGKWQSIDHVLVSPGLTSQVDSVYINDAPFLLEDDPRYGGKRPRRTFQGYRYQRGFSDHLPLVVRFRW